MKEATKKKNATESFGLKVLNCVKTFFKKKENIGIFCMLVSLIMFFSFAKNPIPGFTFLWQKKTLSLQFTLQTGLLALVFQAILYLRGIYSVGFNTQEMDNKEVIKGALNFIINTAIFTSFFAILFAPTGNTTNFFKIFFNSFKRLGIGGGLLCGIVLFGSKDTASVASFLMLVMLFFKCKKNIEIVSKAAGPIGWFYIVLLILGFMIQENISLKQLASDIVNLFSFGKKMAVVAGDATDRCVETGKKIISDATGTKCEGINNNSQFEKSDIQNKRKVDNQEII